MEKDSTQAAYNLLTNFVQADWSKQYLKSTGQVGEKCSCRAGQILLKSTGMKPIAKYFYQSDLGTGISKIIQAYDTVYSSNTIPLGKFLLLPQVEKQIEQLETKVYGAPRKHDWPHYLLTPKRASQKTLKELAIKRNAAQYKDPE